VSQQQTRANSNCEKNKVFLQKAKKRERKKEKPKKAKKTGRKKHETGKKKQEEFRIFSVLFLPPVL